MSVGRARAAGVVGVVGLVLTVAAAVPETSPGLAAAAARAADLFVYVSFRIAAVTVFCLGFAVIVYSAYHQRRGSVDETVARRIAYGVATVLALSLFFPLVVLDDLVVLAGIAVEWAGIDLPEMLLLYASLALFGTLTSVGLVDAVRRRR